jgi:hypothetical protein
VRGLVLVQLLVLLAQVLMLVLALARAVLAQCG